MPDQQHLAYAVARWLRESNKEAAAAEVQTAFGVSLDDAAQKQKYAAGPGLAQIFDVFLKTQSKVTGGSAAAPAAAAATAAPTTKTPSAEDAARAEQLKSDGNKAMSSKDFAGAIAAYTQAIELHPTNPVYFSNRSAAFAQLGQHDKAIDDARQASIVDPKFAKAYSRLGHGLFSSGRFAEAAEAYEQGLQLDPTNGPMKSGLETARKHAAESAPPAASSGDELDAPRGAPGAGAGGMPDLSALAGMLGGMGGGGGMPDLASLMRNPAIMQMANQMMQNGGMEQLMNNPMLRNMMGGAGGQGGMPDINAMMQDPAMREMARNMMGGAGGAPGAGRGNGANSGSGNGNAGGSNGADMFS